MSDAPQDRAGFAFLARRGSQILSLAFAVGITAGIIVYRAPLQAWVARSAYGYLGVFLISLIGNATVILPVPSFAVVLAGGAVMNPVLVGLVAGVGEPLGELTGYLAGYGGRAVIEDRARYERISYWMRRRGFLTLLILSAIPNPFFDIAGITAGMLRFPVLKFLLACWLGKTAKALVLAHLGYLSLDWISSWLG